MSKGLVIVTVALTLTAVRPVLAQSGATGGAGQPAAPGGAVNDANGAGKPGSGTGETGATGGIGESPGKNGPGMGSGNNAVNSPNNPGMDDSKTAPTTLPVVPDH